MIIFNNDVTKSNKAIARLDYNLSNKSKFALFAYNYVKSSKDVTVVVVVRLVVERVMLLL